MDRDISPAAAKEFDILGRIRALIVKSFGRISAIERSIARHREEAMLRALDGRLLQDIGFDPAPTVGIKSDHASRSNFAPLRELFSWARFVK